MDLYHVCSKNAPGVKSGALQGSHVLHRLISGKCEKILRETKSPRVLVIGM